MEYFPSMPNFVNPRQILTSQLANEPWTDSLSAGCSEPPGLDAVFLPFLAVLFVFRMLAKRKREGEDLDLNRPTSSPWRIHLLIGGVGLILLGIVSLGFHLGTRMNTRYAPQIDAVIEIQLKVALAHLWFEEIISGDRNEDIEVVWKNLDQADSCARAMLEGRENAEGPLIPIEDPDMRRGIRDVQEKLKQFQDISQQRLIAKDTAGIGTETDQRFDAIFVDLLDQAGQVETGLRQLVARDLHSFRILQVVLIFASILVTLIVGLVLTIHERHREEGFQALAEMNDSLQEEIIERHRTERTLQESEKFFSGTLNDMLTFVAVLEPDGKVVFVNNTPLDLAGMSLNDLQGTMFYDAFWWQYSEEARQQIKQDIQSCAAGETLVHDIELLTAGKELLWIQYSMHPVYDEFGSIKYLVPEGRDITERKNAEAVLKKSEARLSDAQRIAHLGHWDWDIVTDSLYWSDEIFRIFGLEPEGFEATYDAFLNTLHPDDRDFVRRSVNDALNEGRPYGIDHRIVLPSGEVRIVHEQAEVTFESPDKPIRMIGTVQDITERKRAEEDIQHLRSVLKAIRNVNQLIVHEKNSQELLQEACEILNRTRNYTFVWIGLVEEDTKDILPVARSGIGDGYLNSIKTSWAESEKGMGPTGMAVRTRKPSVMRDIAGDPRYKSWKSEAMKRGYASSAAVPLVYQNRVFGALNVYARIPDSFDEEEINLLVELSQDIAFALHNIELESKHKRIEKDLQAHREENIRLTAIAQEQNELQRWVNTLDTFVGKLDLEGMMILCNEAPLKAAGLTREEVLNRYFPDTPFWSHSETARTGIVETLKLANAGLPSRFETTFRSADGTAVPIIFNCQPVMGSNGKIEYITAEGKTIAKEAQLRSKLQDAKGVLEKRVRERTAKLLKTNERLRNEIAERRRAEKALQENEEKFRHLSEGITEGISVVIDGKYHWLNKAFCEIFGYTQKELLGKGVDVLVVPGEGPLLEGLIESELTGNEATLRYETIAKRKDGERIDIEVSAKSITFEGKQAIQTVIRDITERKKAEFAVQKAHDQLEVKVGERTRELTKANIRLQEIDRLKSEFLATMSHELRTPLNSIIGFTGIILKGLAGEINEEQERQLSMVRGSARHLLSLINDILDLSRIEAGRMELSMAKTDLGAVISEVAEVLSPSMSQKGLRLVIEIQEAVPAIFCDRKKVFQILLNLVNNAMKFTEHGEVRVKCVVQNGMLEVSVSDTGAGIKKENLEFLFEAFRQIDGRAQRRYQGAGLGLFLCKGLVKLCGGDIWVESEFGEGSRFTFTLPVRLEEGEHHEEEDSDRRG